MYEIEATEIQNRSHIHAPSAKIYNIIYKYNYHSTLHVLTLEAICTDLHTTAKSFATAGMDWHYVQQASQWSHGEMSPAPIIPVTSSTRPRARLPVMPCVSRSESVRPRARPLLSSCVLGELMHINTWQNIMIETDMVLVFLFTLRIHLCAMYWILMTPWKLLLLLSATGLTKPVCHFFIALPPVLLSY